MTCSNPPELTEDELSAAVDGEADGQILAHLEQCDGCRARFEAARRIEAQLHRKLFRFDCPSSHQLGEYALDLLEGTERDTIAAHVKKCPRCQAELNTLNQFMASDVLPATDPHPIRQPRPRTFRRRNAWYAHPTQDTIQNPSRGDEGGPLMFEVNGITIFLERNEIEGHLWLDGRLLAPDILAWKDALVELLQDDRVVTVASINEAMSFRCRLQNPFPFDMTITSKTGTVLVIEDIQFVN